MTRIAVSISITARQKAEDNNHIVRRMKRLGPGKWRGDCDKCGMEVYAVLTPEEGIPKYYGRAVADKCDADVLDQLCIQRRSN